MGCSESLIIKTAKSFLICACLFTQGFPLCPGDSLFRNAPQSAIAGAEAQEDDFQKGINNLFDDEEFDIDTSSWNNTKINAGHFDSETWPDTARIVLVDSALKRYYVHPFKNCVTSNFGQRKWLWHYGVDIRLSRGDTVRAAFDGIVRVTEFDRHGYGKAVVIRHASGLETIYGHLSRQLVALNQKVRAGDVVGFGGNTGRSTGSHLHFEMRFYGEPFDPNLIIDFDKYALKSDTLVLSKADFAYLTDMRKAQWHVIRKGETLGHIALWYHTTVKSLCALNHITGTTLLSTGRKLLVRTAPATASKLTLSQKQILKG
ncbi:MAG: peptidoglycan DD-metalloendopeptidase family protein [Chitinivibrionales bacterium]